MRKNIILLILAASVASVSCQKLDTTSGGSSSGSGKGSLVSFNGGLSGVEGLFTKTTYSESTYSGYYRINWENNDPIVIACAQAEAVKSQTYYIKDIQASTDKTSTAKLDNNNKEGLRWGNDDELHTFYAAYRANPLDADNVYGSDALTTAGVAKFNLPSVQEQGTGSGWNTGSTLFTVVPNSKYMFMTAKTTATPTSSQKTPDVSLSFQYLPTVIDFELTSQDEMTINSVSVLSETIDICSDEISADIATDDTYGFPTVTVTTGTDSKKVKVVPMTADSQPVVISSGKTLFCPFFFMTNSTIADGKLTGLWLQLNITVGGDTKILKTKLMKGNEFLKFDAHKRHHIQGMVVPSGISIIVGEKMEFCPWEVLTDDTLDPSTI